MPSAIGALVMAFGLSRRDSSLGDDNDDDPFWWSDAGQAIRWAVFAGFVVVVLLFLLLSHWHAKQRIMKGLPPLWYHRWLLSRRTRPRSNLSYYDRVPDFSFYRQEQYGMHVFPPPVYDPNSAPPPKYQALPGSTKVDPSQGRSPAAGESSTEYASPTRPPSVTRLRADQTGSSAVSNNPY